MKVTHSWNEMGTVGYESPIMEFVNRTTTQVIEERGERIYQAVLDIGIKVDKEELLKALQYDRGQYEKGFRDGQRNAQRWIPCSERLPEESGKYLVQCRNRVNEKIHFEIAHFNVWSDNRKNWLTDGIPMAWMPLPEPYREDGESDG